MSHRRIAAILAVVGLVVLSGCVGGLGGSDTQGPSNATNPDGEVEVHVLNVGQGSSTLIVGPEGDTTLIDSGDWTDDGEDVIAYLEAQGISRIDHLLTSHPDADHIGGHAAVIEHFETERDGIGAVYDPGITSTSATYDSYLDAIEEHDVPLYESRAGDSLNMSGVTVQLLAPPEPYLAGGDRNENSLVVHVQFGASSFLLPGDGEAASEQYLQATYGDDLNSTILAAGHHGSYSSTSEAFLETVSPKAVVISSGYDSQYGHPHEEVLTRLADRSIPTVWTATHGTIVLTSNGSAVTVGTQYDAPTSGTELRAGDPAEPGTTTGITERFIIPAGGTATPLAPAEDGDTSAGSGDDDTDTNGSIASGALAVADINADADGNDNENLNGEYVAFENTGESSLDLSGWEVADEAGTTYTVPNGVTVDPGDQITLYTGSGTDSDSELYWGQSRAVWNNGGDTIIVRDDTDTLVIEEAY
ncbi:competence protein ComEC [Natronoarchaeum philippinense]|uniref:Competence protein ComEC n=1 Tax=Natronoarchaeum philippinense TaxID=558529 RepID=A0A285P0J3_NATPI|nr:lamin tail domain-containing protein [Natronoarchaeum philippinense]SNZ15252.1 competence protein ComEC [Natronoarchaeum philippinense]